MRRFFVTDTGEHIEDMDIFHSSLVLYVRWKGRPGIRVFSLHEGESCGSVAEQVSCCNWVTGER